MQLKDAIPCSEFVRTGPVAVIRFLGAEGCQPAEILDVQFTNYGAARLSRQTINVFLTFPTGRQ